MIGLAKLRAKTKTFEEKRRLCDTYDVFFADKRIIPLLPKVIGKKFFDKKKFVCPNPSLTTVLPVSLPFRTPGCLLSVVLTWRWESPMQTTHSSECGKEKRGQEH